MYVMVGKPVWGTEKIPLGDLGDGNHSDLRLSAAILAKMNRVNNQRSEARETFTRSIAAAQTKDFNQLMQWEQGRFTWSLSQCVQSAGT